MSEFQEDSLYVSGSGNLIQVHDDGESCCRAPGPITLLPSNRPGLSRDMDMTHWNHTSRSIGISLQEDSEFSKLNWVILMDERRRLDSEDREPVRLFVGFNDHRLLRTTTLALEDIELDSHSYEPRFHEHNITLRYAEISRVEYMPGDFVMSPA